MKTQITKISSKNITKLGDNDIAVTIEYGDRIAELTKKNIIGLSKEQIKLNFDKETKKAKKNPLKNSLKKIVLTDIIEDVFFHVNRNGRIVVATGILPAVWPEDETD